MKKFSLEEYLKNPLKKVVTRDGRNVRIICTDAIGSFPIVALVRRYDAAMDNAHQYTKDGRYFTFDEKDDLDLFFAPEKHEGWINLYKGCAGDYNGGKVYTSKEEAKESAYGYCITTKIEWED